MKFTTDDRPVNILIAEDSSASQKAIAAILEPLEAKLFFESDGNHAYYACLKHDIDLLVSDIIMPHLDGYALCKKMKESAATQHIPIILISSLEKQKDILRAFESGANDFVAKTNARQDLLGTVNKLLHQTLLNKHKNILVVDDAKAIRELVEEHLLQQGFKVYIAENGFDALQILEKHKIDLILSDIDMPKMNGLELFKKTRDHRSHTLIPFIVMSSHHEKGLMVHLLQNGIDSYITKPFNMVELVHRIQKLLSDEYKHVLERQNYYKKERELLIGSIYSLVNALEARDSYTRGHSESVASIAVDIYTYIDNDDEEIEILNLAGKLHDIGKIGIRDNILLKEGKLTDEEYDIIKQHPEIGANILRSINSLENIVDIILHHHERFDGKGYPAGLKGGQIPLKSRVLSIADTYDALTSDRAYRKALDHAIAVNIINDNAATQFCPICLNAFNSWAKIKADLLN